MDTKKLRQKILDLAIHGKLVPQDPNDEPASVLLERIRAEKEKLIKEGKIKAPKKSKSAGDTSHYPKEVPFEVPEGWVWCRLEDIAYVATGSTPDKSCFVSNGIPYIKMYNVRNQQVDFDYSPQYINSATHYGQLKRSILYPGDLLMNIVGPPLGKLAIIPDSLLESNTNQAAVVIRPYLYKSVINNYLFYYLEEMSEINSIATKGSAGQVNISLTQSQSMRIPLPPLEEQQQIIYSIQKWLDVVAIIKDGSADLANNINKAKGRVLDLAIHGKLVPQDPSDEPAIELLKRINPDFVPSDNLHYEGDLPNGWCFSTIGDLFKHNTGKALNGRERNGEDQRYITTSNLYWDRFDLKEVRTMPFTEAEKEKCRATKGDLLVCEGGDVGRAAIWPYDFDIMIQNHIHRLRPKEDFSVRFFYYIFLLYKQTGLIGGKGIAILGLSSRELDRMVVPVPPVSEQHRIVSIIEKLFAQMDSLSINLS